VGSVTLKALNDGESLVVRLLPHGVVELIGCFGDRCLTKILVLSRDMVRALKQGEFVEDIPGAIPPDAVVTERPRGSIHPYSPLGDDSISLFFPTWRGAPYDQIVVDKKELLEALRRRRTSN